MTERVEAKVEDKVLEQIIVITFSDPFQVDIQLKGVVSDQMAMAARRLMQMADFMDDANMSANYHRIAQKKAQDDALFSQIARNVKAVKQ